MVINQALLDRMVSEGTARKVSGTGYQIITTPDLQKLTEFELRYTEGFNNRYQERRREEIEAAKRLWREGPWYF